MNERIRELVEQATTKVEYYPPSCDGYTQYRYDFDKEKFAELIVRECVGIVFKRKNQAIDDGWNVDEAMSMAEIELEKHFGVEE